MKNEIGEPNLKKKSSHLGRGESYVVFLDREHRKQLQRQMGGMDLKAGANEKSFCTIDSTAPSGITENVTIVNAVTVDENWLKRTLSSIRAANDGGGGGNAHSLKAKICQSLCSVLPKRMTDMLAQRQKPRDENERVTPVVFGPFLDETFVGFIDRLVYCIYVILGRDVAEVQTATRDAI